MMKKYVATFSGLGQSEADKIKSFTYENCDENEMFENIQNFKNVEFIELNSKGCNLSKIRHFPKLNHLRIINTTYSYKFIISEVGIITPTQSENFHLEFEDSSSSYSINLLLDRFSFINVKKIDIRIETITKNAMLEPEEDLNHNQLLPKTYVCTETNKKYVLKSLKNKANKGYFRAIYKFSENKKVITTVKIYFKQYIMDLINYDDTESSDNEEDEDTAYESEQ